MKKVFQLSIVALAFATIITACEKDEDSGTPSNSSIVGTWELSSEKQVTSINGQVATDTTIVATPGETIVTFNADGTAVNVDGTDTISATYVLTGSNLTIIENNGGDTIQFHTTISNADMTFHTSDTDTVNTNPIMIYSYEYYMNWKRK